MEVKKIMRKTLFLAFFPCALAFGENLPPWFPQVLGMKATFVGQYSTNFNSPLTKDL